MPSEVHRGTINRRDMLKLAGAGVVASGLPLPIGGAVQAQEAGPKEAVIMYPGKPYALWTGVRFWTWSGGISRMLFEPLLDLDADLKPAPGLAESWEILSPTVSRYHLRSNLVWSDGTALTADDVVFSMNLTFNPALSTLMATEISTVLGARELQGVQNAQLSGVRALDALTVEIETAQPDTSILQTLALRWWAPIPRHIYEPILVADFLASPEMQQPPVVSGPFKIDRIETDTWYEMSANPSYWREGKPNLDRLTLVFGNIGDPVALAAQQRFDYLVARQPDVALALADDPNYAVTMVEYIQPYRININCSLPQFADPRVRRAMAYAIDRDTLAGQIWQGNAVPQTTDFLGELLDPDAEQYRYDPDRARQLLSEANWDANQSVFFERTAPTAGQAVDPVAEAEIAAYRQWLGDVGIRLEDRLHPDTATYAEFTRPTGAVAEFGLYDNPHRRYDMYGPLEMKTYLASQPANYAFWTNPEVDALVQQAVATVDQAEYVKLARQLSIIVADQCPYIPTKAVKWGIVASNRFTGYTPIGEAYFAYMRPYDWDVTG